MVKHAALEALGVVHGTVRSLFRLLGALGTTLLVFAAWLGFRLSEAPLELSFLQPYIQSALTRPDGSLTVRIDSTVLVWDREAANLEIRARGVHAMANDIVVAAVPEMSVALSVPSLLKGEMVPRRLRLIHPRVRLVRDAQGNIQMGLGDTDEQQPQVGGDSTKAAEEGFRALLEPPGQGGVAGQLQRVEVVGADVLVQDDALGIQWHAPSADLRFLRDVQGIVAKARFDLELAGERARVDADGLYRANERMLEGTLAYGGLRPSLLAELAPQLKPLAGLHLPTGGTVGLKWPIDKGISDIRFDLAGGAGVIDMSDTLGVSWPVASLSLHGAVSDNLTKVDLEEARVDFGGPLLTLSGHADHIGGPMAAEADAKVDDLPVELLKGLWPPDVAPNPRGWILANLSHGTVKLATAHFAGHVPDGKKIDDIAVDTLGGKVIPEGVDVQYLAPMPIVRNANAEATFDQNKFAIDIKSGEVMGLKVQPGGAVVLSGLMDPLQYADITLKIAGPITDALKLIDSKPLGWAHQLGVEPAAVKGEAVTDLSLRFPLLESLTFDQVKVKAAAQTRGVAIPQVALGLDLTEGTLALEADPKGLDLSGKAKLGGLPADIKWHENFSHQAAVQSHYEVQGVLNNAARAMVGLDVPPFQPPFMSGDVPVQVVANLSSGGRGEIDVKGSLNGVSMSLPSLNWTKKAITPGQASALIRLSAGRLGEIPRFAVSTADGLDVQGQVGFEGGQPRKVTFSRAKWGRSDVKGSIGIKPNGGGLIIDVTGSSFDAREMIGGGPSDLPKEQRPKPDHAHDHDPVVPLWVTAKLDQVWVSDDGVAGDITMAMTRDNRSDIRLLRLDGTVGDGKPLHMQIEPSLQNRRALRITSGDAGSVFKAFGVFDNVVGGQLTLDAYYDDANPREPLIGQCQVTDYQVMKAPALARLLTVAALTGVVELLSGEGINFSTMQVPFVLTDGVLEIKDGQASGTALGLTARGQVDLDNDKLALEGTIVPAYVLNSVLGRIPLLGSIFANEKGGGVIAMNYSMSGPSKDPSVMVNPLSALTPGFLRKLFNIFDDGSGREVRPDEKAPDTKTPDNKTP
ncbi:MAG TPA: AsmA-like C-terminal domain-containing protein [Candidatus Sulfotelmatobacter sp.]|nr:AsmA-like C-terminal domain-containing protein [Candidatus Sulfotelmatobacter sp.]